LGVSPQAIKKFGVVSKEIVDLMLLGCYKLFETDIVCATSGILGPGGGTAQKPVGTVYIGVLYNGKATIIGCQLAGDRKQNKKLAVEQAISLILESISNDANLSPSVGDDGNRPA